MFNTKIRLSKKWIYQYPKFLLWYFTPHTHSASTTSECHGAEVQTARTNTLAVISLLSQLNIFISFLWSNFFIGFQLFLKRKNLKGIKGNCLLPLISKEMWIQLNAIFFDRFETKTLMNSSFILIFLPTNWFSHAHHIFLHFCILNTV